jgi:hypothetical protein
MDASAAVLCPGERTFCDKIKNQSSGQNAAWA